MKITTIVETEERKDKYVIDEEAEQVQYLEAQAYKRGYEDGYHSAYMVYHMMMWKNLK